MAPYLRPHPVAAARAPLSAQTLHPQLRMVSHSPQTHKHISNRFKRSLLTRWAYSAACAAVIVNRS